MLANTVGKLVQKVIADDLQDQHHLFHDLQYGSRRDRSSIGAMMITVSRVERARSQDKRVTLLGKDIVLAFNRVRVGRVVSALREQGLTRLADNCEGFLAPRPFEVAWDAVARGPGRIRHRGTPSNQSSGLSIWPAP